jgi:hypothetical protein
MSKDFSSLLYEVTTATVIPLVDTISHKFMEWVSQASAEWEV